MIVVHFPFQGNTMYLKKIVKEIKQTTYLFDFNADEHQIEQQLNVMIISPDLVVISPAVHYCSPLGFLWCSSPLH